MAAAGGSGKPDDNASLARDAFDRGQAAAAAGDPDAAVRWLDRACRLAPQDQTLALALATACLGRDEPRAARLFGAITAVNDVREAWLGLAMALRRLGDASGAAAALSACLSRHAVAGGVTPIADAIALANAAPGWCGLSGGGVLTIRPALPGLRIKLMLGRPIAVPATGILPRGWQTAAGLTVTTEQGRHLLGSPIDIPALMRLVGTVSSRDGGLEGWAWHPGDTDTDPVLTVQPAVGRKSLRITASAPGDQAGSGGLLGRPRAFAIAADALVGLSGLLHVRGRDGRDLLGSPLDPGAEQRSAVAASAALRELYPSRPEPARRRATSVASPAVPADTIGPRPPVGAAPRVRAMDVVVPVYGAREKTLACLDSVLPTLEAPHRLLVIDDASPDRTLATALDELARRKRIRLIRHPRNLGFPASANTGLAAAAGRDVVLLNSDTLVAPGWLEGLREAAYGAPDIGTATPLSNDATILSYPGGPGENPCPDLGETRRLATLACRANRGTVVDIPVAVGFCMFIRRDCLDAVGVFRADVFAQGYGEENDFCLRARHLGWRHVAVPGVYVAHAGGHSFGAAAAHLRARNGALLERLHPGHMGLIEQFAAAEPLAPAKRRFDLARWRDDRRRGGKGAAILITHADGGGVERQVAVAVARHQAAGRRAIVLRPVRSPVGSKCVCICDGMGNDHPNLRYAMPAELPALRRLLAAERPVEVEIHHMIGHDPSILSLMHDLAVPYDVHVHDYGWLCGRVALVGPEPRYCGEPALIRCEECVADAGNLVDADLSVAALRDRSARLFAGARHVFTPSEDTAARIHRHFPRIRPTVAPHEDDAAIAEPPPPKAARGRCRVCIVGAIGIHKGYQVILNCARNAAERRLPLEFVVVGRTIDDRRLLATGRVFVTGTFEPEEAVALIRAQQATLALVPSIFPETWCLSLGEAWQAGLRVVSFDIGAPAERIRRTGRGLVLPLGLSPAAINNALIAAAGLSRPVQLW